LKRKQQGRASTCDRGCRRLSAALAELGWRFGAGYWPRSGGGGGESGVSFLCAISKPWPEHAA